MKCLRFSVTDGAAICRSEAENRIVGDSVIGLAGLGRCEHVVSELTKPFDDG